MLTSFTLLAPHLPTLVEDQLRGHETPMLRAFAEVSTRLHAELPQVVVAVSARWNAPGPFRVDAGRRHRTLTDYSGFGVVVRHDCPGHPALARAIVESAQKAGLPAGMATRGVDSGVSVPLHFLLAGTRLPVVPMSLPHRAPAECRAWGAQVRRVLDAWPERIAFVVGGVLSHNLHAWNLRREIPEGGAFDQSVLDALARGAWRELDARPAALLAQVQPESGLRHLDVLRGFLGRDVPGVVRGYESLPGLGAALVEFPTSEPVTQVAADGGAVANDDGAPDVP